MSAVVFVNPRAGSGFRRDDLAPRFPAAAVEDCPPDELGPRVEAALEAGAPWIGVAGGDGTIGSAARHLRGGDTPLLAIPAGTRNHFAHDLGLDDLDAAVAAAEEGSVERIALGTIGDATFVNNAGIGMYPALVRHREEMEGRLPKWCAAAVAAVRLLRHPRPLPIETLGRDGKVWMLFAGNGAYGASIGDMTSRSAVGDGQLDVRVLWADRRRTWPRVLFHAATRTMRDGPAAFMERCDRLDISGPAASITVAIDGEVVEIPCPLTIEVEPHALPVLVPPRPEGRD